MTVWWFIYVSLDGKNYNIDNFARAIQPENYSIIGEVKNWDVKKFSKEEADVLMIKHQEVKKMEKLERSVAFILL